MPKKIFYGWYIVAVALSGHFMATGAGFYVFNVFYLPLIQTRGWSHTALNAGPGIGIFSGLLGTLAWGLLAERMRLGRLMAAGALISAISFACMGQVTSIYLYYLCFIGLYFGGGGISGVVANAAVNNWFEKRRGLALGLATTGISLSGVVLPFFALAVLQATNLGAAFLAVASLYLVVGLAGWLVVKNEPAELGLTPDGDGGPGIGPFAALPRKAGPWRLAAIVRAPAFWKVGLAYVLMTMGVGGTMFQLSPRFRDLGYTQRQAILLLMLTALIGALGKFLWGWGCDRFDTRRVVAVLMLTTALGLGLGLLPPSHAGVFAFVFVFGFGMGGMMSTYPVIISFLFGAASFVNVYKYAAMFFGLEVLGYLLMGLSHDLTGSYSPAYSVFVAGSLIAAGLILSIKKPQLATEAGVNAPDQALVGPGPGQIVL